MFDVTTHGRSAGTPGVRFGCRSRAVGRYSPVNGNEERRLIGKAGPVSDLPSMAGKNAVEIQRAYYARTSVDYDARHLREDDEHGIALSFIISAVKQMGPANSILRFVVVAAWRARSLQGRQVWKPLVLYPVTCEVSYVAVPYVDWKPTGGDRNEAQKDDRVR